MFAIDSLKLEIDERACAGMGQRDDDADEEKERKQAAEGPKLYHRVIAGGPDAEAAASRTGREVCAPDRGDAEHAPEAHKADALVQGKDIADVLPGGAEILCPEDDGDKAEKAEGQENVEGIERRILRDLFADRGQRPADLCHALPVL